jgi:hypothetical protein
MRLKRHLNVLGSNEKLIVLNKEMDKKVIETLKRDCKPFLNERKTKYNLLWRGVKRQFEGLKKVKTRMDRKPMDMPVEIKNIFDFEFKKTFGWKPRTEGVFASPNSDVRDYGNQVAILFPIGKYKYVWSDSIEDLWNEVADRGVSASVDEYIEDSLKYFWKPWQRVLDGILDKKKYDDQDWRYGGTFFGRSVSSFKSKKEYVAFISSHYMLKQKREIARAVELYTNKGMWNNRDNEIVINCKSYYLVDEEFESILIKEL